MTQFFRIYAIVILLGVSLMPASHPGATALPGASANGLLLTIDPYQGSDICNLALIVGVSGTQTTPHWPANLDGVTLLMHWSDLETVTTAGIAYTEAGGARFTCPNRDVYTANMATALSLIPPGVHLGLAIKAGMYTPTGLMAPPGAQVASDGPFASVHSMFFSEAPLCMQAPIFWEGAFIQAYEGLMAELAAFLTQQGHTDDLKLVQLSGMDDQTAETYVPTETSGQKISKTLCNGLNIITALDGIAVKPGITSNNQLWLDEGYVAGLGQATFQTIAAAVTQIFPAPDVLFSMAVINFHGLPEDFVTVGPNPLLAPGDFTRTMVGGLVGAQNAMAPVIPASRFAVSWQGLNDCEPRPVPGSAAASRCKSVHGSYSTQLVCEAADGVAVPAGSTNIYNPTLIAWQTNTSYQGAAGCGKPGASVSCTGSEYQGLVENGIDNGATYIEIWPEDVENFNGSNGGKDKTDYITIIHNYWLNKVQPATCYSVDGS
jgi:hypothetical protein